MDKLLVRQSELMVTIERIGVNFSKDSSSGKTLDYSYIEKRIRALGDLWSEFEAIVRTLASYEDNQHEYFAKNIFARIKEYYESTRRYV
ncbi:unnamed protein product [Parnassius apollo]|uniref:(apollo) hypothetical protein n=1 Tax=Parnassius apollo TaxID=110799 RepID=A0A8S3Y6N9_PARAO|nr:unnamed protein product [Parnassius apollo]